MMTYDKVKNPGEIATVPAAFALINLNSIRSISIRITHNWRMHGWRYEKGRIKVREKIDMVRRK